MAPVFIIIFGLSSSLGSFTFSLIGLFSWYIRGLVKVKVDTLGDIKTDALGGFSSLFVRAEAKTNEP